MRLIAAVVPSHTASFNFQTPINNEPSLSCHLMFVITVNLVT